MTNTGKKNIWVRNDAVSKPSRKLLVTVAAAVIGSLILALPASTQQITNEKLSVVINAQDGSYQLAVRGGQPVLTARVGAEVDHQWLRSSDYAQLHASEAAFKDELGSGRQVSVSCAGREGKPELIYVLQLYDEVPYGTVQVKVHNITGKSLTVQAIRSIEGSGQGLIDLGARPSADRVLSDSFSEDWPDMKIYDLGKAPGGMHRGVGSQLIYNRESRQSLFLGALTSDRFLTLLHLKAEDQGGETKITSYAVDSTGTTEIQKDFDLRDSPAEDQLELSLPVRPGEDLASERLLFELGPDYHQQLLAYGTPFAGCTMRVSPVKLPSGGGVGRLTMARSTKEKRWPTPTGRPNT
jgi:hypothetical protein